MKINFYATLRPIVGGKTVEVDLPEGASLHLLLDALTARFPLLQSELFNEDGTLGRAVHVFVNGRDAHWLEGFLDWKLGCCDTIDIFPPVGGGSDELHQLTRDLRGIPLWLLQEYLESVGGLLQDDGWVRGPGWSARLTQLEDFRLGSLQVGQVRLEWQASSQAQAEVWPRLEMKMMRAGG